MTRFVLVLPAYNEEEIIEQSLLKLDYFLRKNYQPDEYALVVSDNNSSDRTAEIVRSLTDCIQNLKYHFTPVQGKGKAIKSAWEEALSEEHEVLAFMDADLATGLEAFPELILRARQSGMAIGDRYHPDSSVERTRKRKAVSYGYRTLMRVILNSDVSDFPCGFKAVRKDLAKEILPKIENLSWFFDSELVYCAERSGCAVFEVPVRWKDPRSRVEQSKVNIPRVAAQYMREIIRLKNRRW